MPYKIEQVQSADEHEIIGEREFVAIAECPRCGARWRSAGPLHADDPAASEKQGARRLEMLTQFRGGCPNCARDGAGVRQRQHGRLRSAWPGSRR